MAPVGPGFSLRWRSFLAAALAPPLRVPQRLTAAAALLLALLHASPASAHTVIPFEHELYAREADCVMEAAVVGAQQVDTWRGRAVAALSIAETYSLRCKPGVGSPLAESIQTLISTPGSWVDGASPWEPGAYRLYLKRSGAGPVWGVLGLAEGAQRLDRGSAVAPPNMLKFNTDNRGPAGSPLRWPDGVDPGFVLIDDTPSGLAIEQVEAEVIAALETWSAVPCSERSLSFDGIVEYDSDEWQGRNHVAIVSDEAIFAGGRLVLGSTGVNYDDETGELLSASVLLNGVAVSWSVAGVDDQTWNIRGVLMHELGHALGLAHSEVIEAVMAGVISAPLSRAFQRLHDDDINGLCSLYPCAAGFQSCGGPQPPMGEGIIAGSPMCAPCSSDSDCGGSRDRCDGRYCLSECSMMSGCVDGARCTQVENVPTSQCWPDDDLCERRAAAACEPCTYCHGDDCPPDDELTTCAAGVCAAEGACYVSCSDELACPGGFECTESGALGAVCLPSGADRCAEEPDQVTEPDDDGCGSCSASGGMFGGWLWLVLAALARRRRLVVG